MTQPRYKKVAPTSAQPLSPFFAEFCESQTHFDSLLSRIDSNQKSKIAVKMGMFLRRPWALAEHYGIALAPTSADFWEQGFTRLKKSEPVHELLTALWKSDFGVPNEGTVDDFPPEMIESWTKDWGAEIASKMARLLSQDPLTTIRLTRKADRDALIAQVSAQASEGAPPGKGGAVSLKPRDGYYSPRALVFKGYASVQRTEAFQQGWLEIQDEGSQVMSAFALADDAVAPALHDGPATARKPFDARELGVRLGTVVPQTVVDACAGSGGKTLALADFLRGQGRVYAYDIYDRKIQALRKRADRAGETSVQAVTIDETTREGLRKFEGTVDRLLLDSPCSGWGVLRRNPDIKWARKPRAEGSVAHPDRPIEELQHEVVRAYLPLLKPGGVFTFGVCTFQKSETTDQVEWILREFPELRLRHQGFIGPHETDGFFMASFVLKADSKGL
jgi:16S rRNA C967 or C1407 C5-methylase (RsmB/RsmF family)